MTSYEDKNGHGKGIRNDLLWKEMKAKTTVRARTTILTKKRRTRSRKLRVTAANGRARLRLKRIATPILKLARINLPWNLVALVVV